MREPKYDNTFDGIERTCIGGIILFIGVIVVAFAVKFGAGPAEMVAALFSPVVFLAVSYVIGTLFDRNSWVWRRARRWLD